MITKGMRITVAAMADLEALKNLIQHRSPDERGGERSRVQAVGYDVRKAILSNVFKTTVRFCRVSRIGLVGATNLT